MNAARRLVYQFMEIAHVTRLGILTDMGLTDTHDDEFNEKDRNVLYLKRATSRGLVPELRRRIEAAHRELYPERYEEKAMPIEQKDAHVELFMGSTFKLDNPKTVGAMKGQIREILANLPKDDSLEVSDAWFRADEFGYVLAKGVVTGN